LCDLVFGSLPLPRSLCPPFFFSAYPPHRPLHSFPTRRSSDLVPGLLEHPVPQPGVPGGQLRDLLAPGHVPPDGRAGAGQQHRDRSEEHTSELQSRFDLVCRLLLEKKKKKQSEENIEIVAKGVT